MNLNQLSNELQANMTALLGGVTDAEALDALDELKARKLLEPIVDRRGRDGVEQIDRRGGYAAVRGVR